MKKSDTNTREFRLAQAHAKRAWDTLTERRERALDSLRQVDDTLDALKPVVAVLFGRRQEG